MLATIERRCGPIAKLFIVYDIYVHVDILEFPTQTFNVCAHPRNRVAQAKARGEDFWAFVINYVVPGPPHLTYTMYFVGDKVSIHLVLTSNTS